MAVLFEAISHGCAAGRYSEVLEQVYIDRVIQVYDYISTVKLGAYGAGLKKEHCPDSSTKKINSPSRRSSRASAPMSCMNRQCICWDWGK